MKTNEIIRQIDDNQTSIAGYGEFSADILKKINYKFRLDWNYFSNRMEGGTLTREETRSVMVGNIDVKGKPLKDVLEMTGHDRMVLDILKMGKGEQRISEKRIKAIHKAIMHEDNPEKTEWIGSWKKTDNHVISYKGEKIDFASPLDVPEKIHGLLDKTNAELDKYFSGKSSKHPLAIAAQFHIDFVTIHPFYDGNGRTTRILTNLILISCGLPPIVIKDQHKQSYYQLLADVQVYGGDVDLFVGFVGERVLESQELVMSALRGEEIEEKDDLYKEINLWKKQLPSDGEVQNRNDELIAGVYNYSLKPLFEHFLKSYEEFNDLFTEIKVYNRINDIMRVNRGMDFFDAWATFMVKSSVANDNNDAELDVELVIQGMEYNSIGKIREMELSMHYAGFNKNGANTFDESVGFKVLFDKFHYRITGKYDQTINYFKKLYTEKLTEEEISEFVRNRMRETFENIKASVARMNSKDK